MGKPRDLGELARRVYWRAEDARRVVDAWRRTGEPVSVFARRLRIDPRRLSRWAARLTAPSDGVRFVPVHVTGHAATLRAPIHIELPHGCHVRVPPGFAADDLRRVLAVLEERMPC